LKGEKRKRERTRHEMKKVRGKGKEIKNGLLSFLPLGPSPIEKEKGKKRRSRIFGRKGEEEEGKETALLPLLPWRKEKKDTNSPPQSKEERDGGRKKKEGMDDSRIVDDPVCLLGRKKERKDFVGLGKGK